MRFAIARIARRASSSPDSPRLRCALSTRVIQRYPVEISGRNIRAFRSSNASNSARAPRSSAIIAKYGDSSNPLTRSSGNAPPPSATGQAQSQPSAVSVRRNSKRKFIRPIVAPRTNILQLRRQHLAKHAVDLAPLRLQPRHNHRDLGFRSIFQKSAAPIVLQRLAPRVHLAVSTSIRRLT